MITLLESFLPKWLIEALVIGVLIITAVLYFEHKGRVAELGQLQQTAGALVTKVVAQNTADTAQYQADVTANQEKTNAALKSVADLQSQLADSVRGFDAYRRLHPEVARATSPAGAASAGECGLEDCGTVIDRLAVRGNELAGSVGILGLDLQSCQRDRDALTGEPK